MSFIFLSVLSVVIGLLDHLSKNEIAVFFFTIQIFMKTDFESLTFNVFVYVYV